MLRTCTWCAAIQAAPALWPEAVLTGRSADYSDWEWNGNVGSDNVQRALKAASFANQKLLQRAAGLDALTWRVRIAGCNEVGGCPARRQLLRVLTNSASH